MRNPTTTKRGSGRRHVNGHKKAKSGAMTPEMVALQRTLMKAGVMR